MYRRSINDSKFNKYLHIRNVTALQNIEGGLHFIFERKEDQILKENEVRKEMKMIFGNSH